MSASELAFVGDVHLDRDDPDLEPFLRFLDALAARSARIVLLGDLFHLWLAGPGLDQPHQLAVTERLAALRRRGVCVRYLEGNRDYGVAATHLGTAFDDVEADGRFEDWAGRRLWVAHGDLVNVDDRRYRAWRRASRAAFRWNLLGVLPARRRVELGLALERRLRRMNLDFKRELPEGHLRRYGDERVRAGADAVVLGHFHVERTIELDGPGAGRLYIVPEWKGSRRYLRASAEGALDFVEA